MSESDFCFEGTVEDFLLPSVLAVCEDLEVVTHLPGIVSGAGGRLVLLQDRHTLLQAVDRHYPVIMLLDLSIAVDWALAIQRCKARPHSRSMQVVAFADRDHEEFLQQTLTMGADHARPKAKLLAELESVVGQQVNPAIRYLEGWNDELPEKARLGLTLLNVGDYFEQHELLEEAWLAEARPIRLLYQGILQIGVALLQIERANWPGAIKMFRRGLPKLRSMPARCQGIDVGNFRTQAEQIHAVLCVGGPDTVVRFDRSLFPQITF